MASKAVIKKAYAFIHDLRPLKDNPRYANNPFVEKGDVVGSHTWRAETFPIILHDQFKEEGIDPLRILELLNVHDWVEIESKKVEALGFRDRSAKAKYEEKVLKKLLARFPREEGKRMRDLLTEMHNQETIEAKAAKALENLESNMHVIEEVKPILDPEHRQRTIDYIERRRGICKTVDVLIAIQLAEIDKIVEENS